MSTFANDAKFESLSETLENSLKLNLSSIVFREFLIPFFTLSLYIDYLRKIYLWDIPKKVVDSIKIWWVRGAILYFHLQILANLA